MFACRWSLHTHHSLCGRWLPDMAGNYSRAALNWVVAGDRWRCWLVILAGGGVWRGCRLRGRWRHWPSRRESGTRIQKGIEFTFFCYVSRLRRLYYVLLRIKKAEHRIHLEIHNDEIL